MPRLTTNHESYVFLPFHFPPPTCPQLGITSNSRAAVDCNTVNRTCCFNTPPNALMAWRISTSRAARPSYVYRRRGPSGIYRTLSVVLRPCSVYLRISFPPLSAHARICVIGFADPIRIAVLSPFGLRAPVRLSIRWTVRNAPGGQSSAAVRCTNFPTGFARRAIIKRALAETWSVHTRDAQDGMVINWRDELWLSRFDTARVRWIRGRKKFDEINQPPLWNTFTDF